MGFVYTIPVFGCYKAFHFLDDTATVIGHHKVKDVRVGKIWNAHGRDAKHKTSV